MITQLDLFLAIFAAMTLSRAVTWTVSTTLTTISMRRFNRESEEFIKTGQIRPGIGRIGPGLPPSVFDENYKPPWARFEDRIAALEKRLDEKP